VFVRFLCHFVTRESVFVFWGCALWTRRNNFGSFFGMKVSPLTTPGNCQSQCLAMPSCVAADVSVPYSLCVLHNRTATGEPSAVFTRYIRNPRCTTTRATPPQTTSGNWCTYKIIECWLNFVNELLYLNLFISTLPIYPWVYSSQGLKAIKTAVMAIGFDLPVIRRTASNRWNATGRCWNKNEDDEAVYLNLFIVFILFFTFGIIDLEG